MNHCRFFMIILFKTILITEVSVNAILLEIYLFGIFVLLMYLKMIFAGVAAARPGSKVFVRVAGGAAGRQANSRARLAVT